MKLTKSYLRHIINEEFEGILQEIASQRLRQETKRLSERGKDRTQHIGGGVSKTDPGHFDYDEGEDEVFEEGEDEHGNYVWDKTVKRSEDAMKRKKKKRSSDWMPDHIRGKRRNPKTGKDEPHQEGLDESDDWIQKADADIKRRGTKGRCTGDKATCTPKRKALAKTFKKMGHERWERDHHEGSDYKRDD